MMASQRIASATQSEDVYVWDFFGDDLATWFASLGLRKRREAGLPYVTGKELSKNDKYKIQLKVGIDVPDSLCGIAPAEEQLEQSRR